MPIQKVNNAPVDAVGGPQDRGPWPDSIEEIAVDDRLTRPVTLEDGTTEDREVVVKDLHQIVRDDGSETDGFAVTYQHGGGI